MKSTNATRANDKKFKIIQDCELSKSFQFVRIFHNFLKFEIKPVKAVKYVLKDFY